MKGAYKSYIISGLQKTGVDRYISRVTPQVKRLIEDQLQELGSAKVIMTLWIKWKKLSEGNSDSYIRTEMSFNSKMTEFFQGSDIDGLLGVMFSHIKTQIGNPKMPQSGFTSHAHIC